MASGALLGATRLTEHSGIGKTWDQRLFALLWIWTAFRTLVPWLVFFRLTLEGDSYRWGTQYFDWTFYSSGFARPDFLLIYALVAIGIFVLWQMRRYRLSVAATALVIYLGVLAADALYQFNRGVPIVFQGDTLGVKLDISIPFYGLQFLMFVVALAWWFGVRDISPATPPVLSNTRRNIVRVCGLFVPIQVLLLVSGEPHGTTDAIGVIGTLTQWVLLAYAFYPGANYRP